MRALLSAFVATALTATPAIAQTFSLHPGETVTIRFDDGQPVIEATGQAAPITEYEAYAIWRAEAQDVPPGASTVPPGFLSKGEGPPNPPSPIDDRLRITMRLVPSDHPGAAEDSVLFLSNGYGSAVKYRAVMGAGTRSSPTDVCDVAPHLLGLEHWPYALDRLDLSDLRLVEWSGAVSCN